ncbi:MAG: hypothetical protein AABW51_00375 [Nanoarchaeota archaeon]
MLESLVRGKFGKGLMTATLLSTLLFNCSKKPNQPEPLIPKDSVMVTIDASKDNSVKLDDYSVFIPANSVQNDSTNEATITLKKDNLEIPDSLASSSTGALTFSIDKSLEDTIFFKFPKISDVPSGFAVIRNNLDSSYQITEGKIEGDSVRVPYFQSSSLTGKINSTIPGVTINFNFDSPLLYQPADLQGDFSSIVSSNEPIAVLVHGLNSSPDCFKDYSAFFRSFSSMMGNLYGNRVLFYQYPSGKKVSENASTLYEKLEDKILITNPNIEIDLIGHSMGGIVGRKTLLNHPEKFRNLITLGSPHDGVFDKEWAASIKAVMNGSILDSYFESRGLFSDGAKDLYKGSDFLKYLNSSGKIVQSRYLNVAGNKEGFFSQIISGEDDGFIQVSSAKPQFLSPKEQPSLAESFLINSDHQELNNANPYVFYKIRNLIWPDIDTTASFSGYFFGGAIVSGPIRELAQQIKISKTGKLSGLEVYVTNYIYYSDNTFPNFKWRLKDASNFDLQSLNIDDLSVLDSGVAVANQPNSYSSGPIKLSLNYSIPVVSGKDIMLTISYAPSNSSNSPTWNSGPDWFYNPSKNFIKTSDGWSFKETPNQFGRNLFIDTDQ